MSACKRPRDAAHAPKGPNESKTRPERIDVRATTEQCGRFYSSVSLARSLHRAAHPTLPDLLMCEAVHDFIIPTFEKVVRGYVYGSAAERATCAIYLEKLIRKDDYLSVRRALNPSQEAAGFFTQSEFNFKGV